MTILHTLALVISPIASPQCPEWSADYLSGGPNGSVTTQLVLPRGTGDVLLFAGTFDHVAGTPAPGLAFWDGVAVTAFPVAAPGTVRSLAFADLGAGPTLFAAGDGFLGRWTGSAWEVLSTHDRAYGLEAFDDGTGPALYYAVLGGGMFRYDGAVMEVASALQLGGTPTVLEVHDPGTGPGLYLAGLFTTATHGDQCVLRLDGSGLFPAGLPGDSGLFGSGIEALTSYVTPGGVPELHAIGAALVGGVQPSVGWHVLDGSGWRTIRDDFQASVLTEREGTGGRELATIDGQRRLFTYRGGAPEEQMIDTPIFAGAGLGSSGSFVAFGDDLPQDVYVTQIISTLNGSSLLRVSGGTVTGLFDTNTFERPGSALEAHDFGDGPAAVIFGADRSANRRSAFRYDGSSWNAIPGSEIAEGSIVSAASLGPDLYVAGRDIVAPVAASVPGATNQSFAVARLTPGGYEPLRSSGDPLFSGFEVAVQAFDGQLYTGGFTTVTFPQSTPRGLARWTGSEWERVGAGFTNPPVGQPIGVAEMVVWDDGTGPALFVAGRFREVAGVQANHIARWDGQSWSALGSGFPGPVPPSIFGLCGWNSPTGPMLVAAGAFTGVDGRPTTSIAAWDGSAWQDLGSGPPAAPLPVIRSIVAHDPDGRGERLYIAGEFDSFAGAAARGVAEYDGVAWREANLPRRTGAITSPITAMLSGDFGGGRELVVAGAFDRAPGQPSHRVAVLQDPCGAIVGTPVCTALPNSTGVVGVTRARGRAEVTSNDLTLEARGLPAFQTALAFAGTTTPVVPAGNGLRCIGGSLARLLPAMSADADGRATLPLDLTAAPLAALGLSGTTLTFQTFFRDAGPSGFSTTDAIEVRLR